MQYKRLSGTEDFVVRSALIKYISSHQQVLSHLNLDRMPVTEKNMTEELEAAHQLLEKVSNLRLEESDAS